MQRGAHLFRVHHVKAAVQAVKMLWAVQQAPLPR
jgi:dihydropteroate synthase